MKVQIQQESAQGTSENDVLYGIKNVSMNHDVIMTGNLQALKDHDASWDIHL
jgi:hypothetical protein